MPGNTDIRPFFLKIHFLTVFFFHVYSQAHKHVQILPLKRDNKPQPPIKKLYDEIHDRHIGKVLKLRSTVY